MNRRASADTGIYILFSVFLGLLVLATLAASTSEVFGSVGSSYGGFAGFVVSNFNVVLLLALTVLGFIGIASFRT